METCPICNNNKPDRIWTPCSLGFIEAPGCPIRSLPHTLPICQECANLLIHAFSKVTPGMLINIAHALIGFAFRGNVTTNAQPES